MALSVSPSVAEDEVLSLWEERRPAFVLPTVIRSDRPRVHRGYRRTRVARSEPSRSPAKRIFDVIGASLALLLLAPLFAVVAIAIKATSSGPVFFHQHRYGYRNHRFRIYKFRTMYTHLNDPTGVR